MLTIEDRMKPFEKLREDKKTEVTCPVCGTPYPNRYSLSNHFMIRGCESGVKFKDSAHEDYWNETKKLLKKEHEKEILSRIYDKLCIRCNKSFNVDYLHRFQKRCSVCEILYPIKNKINATEVIEAFCIRCGLPVSALKGTTLIVCEECRKKEKEEKNNKILETKIFLNCISCREPVEYKKKHIRDHTFRILCEKCKATDWFKNDEKYNKVIMLLQDSTLSRRDIKKLLSLEIDYVREAAIDKYGEEWYANRVLMIRKQAAPIMQQQRIMFFKELRKDKQKFDKWFEARAIKSNPSSLEYSFRDFLTKQSIGFVPNSWITVKVNDLYERREIDIKVPLEDTGRKFSIFIDGEAFHGKNTYFRGSTVEAEQGSTKAVASLGYFTIRYSESEIKSGWAFDHFKNLYNEFKNNIPKYYYRNWMTGEELKV